MPVTAQVRPNWKRSWLLRFIAGGRSLEFSSDKGPALKLVWNFTQGMAFDPSTFELTVFGLSPDARAIAGRKGTIVELYAGYETQGRPLLYRGAIFWSLPVIEGADHGLRVQSAGGAAGRAVVSLPAGTSHDEVLTQILAAWASQLGLEIRRGTVQTPAGAITQARTLRGTPEQLLRAWADEHGLEADIVNGVCQAMPAGGSTGERVIVLDADTGLEGGPEPIMAGFGAMVFTPRGCRFQCRLNAEVRIGRRVRVRHQLIPGGQGDYIVRRVVSQGDTRGQAWTMGIEATGPV